ncbi:ATP-binding protein [Candidatus Binatia bacterium]|nr:ATP-binding protein [Candidatus Binatia bacterium]
MGYSDLLLEGEYGDLTTEQADIVRRVDRSAGELLELINATLDLSRLEAGRLSLKEQSVDVAALLREIDQETQPLQQDKPALALEWIAPARLRSIRTDRTKLKVVIKNLVTNAIKFTDTGGVSITATPREGGVEIAVRDTGIGIAPQDLDMIFEPFRQLDSSVTRRFSGVGLGLYIVRRLVDMLGGTIEVESAAGSGSTFRVWVRSARNGTET